MPNAAEQTRALLKELVETKFAGDFKKASEFLGVDLKSGILRKWVNGERTPNLNNASALYQRLGVTLNIPDAQAFDYEFIPKHAARPGAGASLETSDATEGFYAFRKDWLGQMNIHAGSAVLLSVVGDSMEPLLKEGDTLLVDKNDTEIMDGRIYVVTLGEELRVKRVYRGLTGIILRSENQRYPDVHVDPPDLDVFRIHGRVRWVGKEL